MRRCSRSSSVLESGALAAALAGTKRLAIAAVLGLLASEVAAQAASPEFQVNQTWRCTQYPGSVVATGDGGFVVIWGSIIEGLVLPTVLGRRYGGAGTALTGEFLLDDAGGLGVELNPAVAATPDAGGFVAVWERWLAPPSGLRGRVFPASPQAAPPSEFSVTADTDGPYAARVGTDSTGAIVVAWLAGPDTGRLVRARRFTAAGDPRGPEIEVSGGPTSQPGGYPGVDLAVARDGSFLVVWKDSSAQGLEVLGQAFDAAGNPIGAKTVLSSSPADPYANVRVAAESGSRGGYLIVWQSGGGPGLATDLWARLVSKNGVPRRSFLLHQTSTGFWLGGFGVAIGQQGDLAAVWTECQGGAVSGNLSCHPFGGRYSQSGAPTVATFRLSPFRRYQQVAAAATLLPTSGDLVAIWESLGATAALCGTPSEDGDASGVFARMFPPASHQGGAEQP